MRAVPCSRANPAATYCTDLGDRGDVGYMVTAAATGGRRLLADGTADTLTANMTRDAACQDALGAPTHM